MLVERLERAMDRKVESARARSAAGRATLEAVAPARVLERGFAIVEGAGGVVVSPSAVRSGERLRVRVAEGSFHVRVEESADGSATIGW